MLLLAPWSTLGLCALLASSTSTFVSAASRTIPADHAAPRIPQKGAPSLSYRFGRYLPGINPLDPFDDHNLRDSFDVLKPSASSASPSLAPAPTATSTIVQGSVQVRASNNTVLGFLANTPQGLNGVTTNLTNKLSVTLDISKSSLAPVDITAQNPKFPGSNKLGGVAVSPDASPNLAGDSNNAVLLSNVPQTPPGSRPVPTLQGVAESAIWTLNQVTAELTAHWINSNGQSPPTIIAYNQNNDTLYFVGQQPTGDLISVAFFLDSDL